ncbi:MAG: sigma-70 family RNA polymerase sigma factor [Planctomycetota bacterium]
MARPLLRKLAAHRAKPQPVLDLATLDARLDVPVDAFDRRVQTVIRELRNSGARIVVPDSPILNNFQSTAVGWTNLFETQIRQLPRHDRAEEFRMARRYAFLKARVRAALLRVGHPKEIVDDLVLRPMHALPPLRKPAASKDIAHLDQAIDELGRLRNAYVEGSLYLVFGPVRRYRDLGVDEGDLIQEAAASLFQAIDGFDWRRDVRFKTYAIYWIQQAILKTLYNASRTVRIPIWVQKTLRKIRRVQESVLLETGKLPENSTVAEKIGLPVEKVEEILVVRRYAVSLDATRPGDDDSGTLGSMLPDESLVPIHETIREGDLGVELSALLGELPDRERTILTRRFGLGGREPETLAEIAKDMGVTAERIRQLQKVAIGRLQGPEALGRLEQFA